MNPCEIMRGEFSKWLSTSSESSLAFRSYCLETSKSIYKKNGKGFITLEFDSPEEALIYIMFTPSVDVKYTVIKREGIPTEFRSIYDRVNMDTHFLLYVVFGKKHPLCISMMREVAQKP